MLLMSGLLASTPARADDVVSYEVVGDADASGADARTVALDDAFARATQTVVRELVAGDVRAARKADLDREIVGHARLWVVGFGVTHDDSHDGRRELTVAVRIDRDKLRARLGQLNVALIGGPDKSRGVVVLVRVTSSTGVEASYGPDAKDDMAALTSLTQAMQHAGLALRHAPTSGAAARGAGELPLDDGEATALAADAKAELALIAGVEVGDAVVVRGIATTARPVAVHVRMVVPGKPDDARDGNARARPRWATRRQRSQRRRRARSRRRPPTRCRRRSSNSPPRSCTGATTRPRPSRASCSCDCRRRRPSSSSRRRSSCSRAAAARPRRTCAGCRRRAG